MHASMAKDDGESSPAFPSRLLAVWRYVVVSVVTAVAVAVVIRTMSAGVLRHDNLQLVVAQGSVQVTSIQKIPPPEVGIAFGVTARNQIGKYIAYTNVSVRLFAGALTSDEADTIAHFNLSGPLVVPPNVEQDILVDNELHDLPKRYVQTLYDEGVIAAAMRLDGDLEVFLTNPERNHKITGVMDHHMSGPRPVTYYCWPLTVGYGNLHSNNDVSCITV